MNHAARLVALEEMMSKMKWDYQSLDDSARWRRWDQCLIEISRASGDLRQEGFVAEVDALWNRYGPRKD